MKRRANPPPRPTALWAATLVVSLQCWSVPTWLYITWTAAGGKFLAVITAFAALLGAMIMACQAVAVFRREWAASWGAAAAVGFVFVVPGGFCASSVPVHLLAVAVGDMPADPRVFWVIALEGLWAVTVLFAGGVMSWWAVRLYRWRSAPRSKGRRRSRTATADAATPP